MKPHIFFPHSLPNTWCEQHYKCMTVGKEFDLNIKFTHEHMLYERRNIE